MNNKLSGEDILAMVSYIEETHHIKITCSNCGDEHELEQEDSFSLKDKADFLADALDNGRKEVETDCGTSLFCPECTCYL